MTIQEADKHFIHTYNRSVVFTKGEGMYLYDDQGKKYLDMGAGIAVSALGYSNEEFKQALKDQIDDLIHISNLYYTKPAIKAAELICNVSGMDRVFFTNSGAEAIEGAIKLARKYAFNKNPQSKGEVIAMDHSFHGRTMGALSVTGTKHYREAFEPLIGGVSFATYNDLESVKALVTDETCAILLETLQGEGGIHPATPEFIKGLRTLCDEKDIALIFDEIQCGMGRTGKMYTYQHYGVTPDILTTAKALGCGVPVGAFVAGEKTCNSLVPGDHGTTYGGNPLCCAAVSKTIEIFEKEHMLDHVNEIAPYLTQKLQEIVDTCDAAVKVKGRGLIQGLQITKPLGEVTAKALEEGLLIIGAGTDVIRMIPPLVIGKEQVDEMVEILKKALA